jgi:hypothetical protein
MRALVAAAVAVGVAACDSIPRLEVRNSTLGTVTLRDARAPGIFDVSERPVSLAPGRAVQVLLEGRLTLKNGDCDLAYDLPRRDISTYMNAVTLIQLGSDARIYLRATRGNGGPGPYRYFDEHSQPDGWPVTPSSKTCG